MTTPAEKTPAELYRDQNVYEGPPTVDEVSPKGARILRKLAEREPELVNQMARVAAATDCAYNYLRVRRNEDGSITLRPDEATRVLEHLELKHH